MNKKELLEDLKTLPFCAGLNGEPKATPDSPKADGGIWYAQNVREINPDGKSATYRNIHFYVFNEGKKDEVAYYKDEIPTEITKKAYVFTEKIKKFADENKLVSIEKTEEDRKFAIVKQYIEDETGVVEKKLLIKELEDGTLITKEFK